MANPYISEVKYIGGASLDFIEVAVDAGMNVSALVVTVYHANGTVRSTNSLGSLVSTQHGKDIYIIDTATSGTFTGLSKSGAVAIGDGTTVFQFISFDHGSPVVATAGPANGTTSTQIGLAGSGKSLETTDGGSTYSTQTTPSSGSIPCFLKGTLIETPNGPVAVETLKPGMLVKTLANGLRPIEMCLSRRASARRESGTEHFFPIRIAKGAIGPNIPSQDLYVSRQHRILVSSKIAMRMFGNSEVLVAAVKLLGLPGVEIAYECEEPVYFHLLLQSHDVVVANGAPCESFLLAPQSMQAVERLVQKRIFARFPKAKCDGYQEVAAYMIPPGARQRRLIERQIRNRQQLFVGRC